MNDYEQSLKFWDDSLGEVEPYKVDGKWIEDEKFNTILKEYINDESVILDYGCGSAWAIFEAYFTTKFKKGLAIDPSKKVIASNIESSKLSNISNIDFIAGDERVLDDYQNQFDFAMSFNVLDVVPDEITNAIVIALHKAVKKDGYVFIGINPEFSEDQLINLLKMEKKGHYFYKDGILRANIKNKEEWYQLFNNYFDVVDHFQFALQEHEKKYPRVGFLLKNK